MTSYDLHPYADPRCGICRGSGSTTAKHPLDGGPLDVDCWCVDPTVEYPDPDEYDGVADDTR